MTAIATTSLPPMARRARRRSAALGLLAWVAGILFCLPVFWMLLTSLHSEPDAATNPPSLTASLTLDG
ncbi:carbohydrate ABC transporter permease, partial [Streptomyces sp. NPDC057654]